MDNGYIFREAGKMKTFDEEFKEKFPSMIDRTLFYDKVVLKDIERNCLDKQKVREAIEETLFDSRYEVIRLKEELLKELGL